MNYEGFTASFFKANRQRLKTLFAGTAPIVLTANGLLQRNSDITYPFRQESNFWYVTGIDEPDIILVIDKSNEYLIVPDRDKVRQTFDGLVNYEYLASVSGIAQIYDEKSGWQKLNSRLRRVKHVATLPSPATYDERHGIYTNPARTRMIERIKSANDNLELLDLRNHFARMRVIKQPEELIAINKAIDITTNAFNQVVSKLSTYKSETDVLRSIEVYFSKHGVTHAYQPIIASGDNACILHYIKNNEIISGNLILLDVGAEFKNYASDITRTYSIGKPSKRQKSVYEAVVEVQNYALSLLKPGTVIREYGQQIEKFMGEKLRELGLIKTVDHDSVRRYYPHATSHFLGLDTHDIGDYDQPLEVGAVITVEPGIYIPEESIGIRIEDDISITKSGSEVLSKSLPRTLE